MLSCGTWGATFEVVVDAASKTSEVGLTSTSPLSTGLPLSHHMEDEDGNPSHHSSLLNNTPDRSRSSIPWFAWTLLGASLLAVSSAAVVFASIPDVPTFTLAAWRLQLTAFLLTPAAIHQYRQLTTGTVHYRLALLQWLLDPSCTPMLMLMATVGCTAALLFHVACQ